MNQTTFRYFAFLRAINVGGHTVKMEFLRNICEELGFSHVETFIASGNIIFESPIPDVRPLEIKMETMFSETLAYPVTTFLRTEAELSAIHSYQPFSQARLDSAQAFNIAFLSEAPDQNSLQKLMARETDIDAFHSSGREIYWLCMKKQSESTFSNVALEKTLGQKSTLRGIQTIHNLAAKYLNNND